MYGPGALGFGDVTLSMTMGAMLGALLIVFTLILAILIGAVTAAGILLVYGRERRIYIPYGQFLAVAAMIMLVWGQQIVSWYLGI